MDQFLLKRLVVYQVGNDEEGQEDHGHDLQGQILVCKLCHDDKDHASQDEHKWVEKACARIFAKALKNGAIFFIEVFVFPFGELATVEDEHEDWEGSNGTSKDDR